jgi:hypothetical protein
VTLVTVPSGPLKRDLIQQAYEECGQAAYEYDLSPEEYASALRRLNAMLAEWKAGYSIDIGYLFPDNGTDGNIEDGSGIPFGAVQCVAGMLAVRIAPAMGKTISPETKAAISQSWMLLRANYAQIPEMQFGRNTIRGAGNRRARWWGPFFPVCQTCNRSTGYDQPNSCTCGTTSLVRDC